MAENPDGQEKKHDPSAKKWREAYEKGQTPKSQDFSAAAVLLAGTGALVFASGELGQRLMSLFIRLYDFGPDPTVNSETFQAIAQDAMLTVAWAIAVPLGAVAAASTLVNLAQTQFRIAPKALEPDLAKLNPFTTFKSKYMSWQPVVELVKGAGKLLLVAVVIAWTLYDRFDTYPALAALTPAQVLANMADLAWTMVVAAMPFILVLAILDYAYAYYRQNEQLKRTDQDVKEENKAQEGDPKVKGQRKHKALQLLFGQSMRALEEADVVVMNPTHFAIALRYRRGIDDAPVVLAKGVDHLALRMRKRALELGIPRVEDRPLARALYRQVDPGEPIPEELYGPIAKVLAVVYRRRARRRQRPR